MTSSTTANGTATAADSTTESSTTTDADKAQAALAGFHEMVTSMSSSLPPDNAEGGKADTASIIGKLKIIDKAITALDADPTLKGIKLLSDMAELALASLPEDTKKVLDSAGCGSDVAMVLVRRSFTQLPTLAKTLYTATAEALDADKELRSLHGELSSPLELYGALVSKGVNPRTRPWADRLTEKFSSISELKWISWRRLMHLVGVGTPLGADEAADAEASEDEEDTPNGDATAKDAEAAQKAKQEKKEQEAAIAAARPLVRHPPALSKGEVKILEQLYSTGSDVPPIRKQALDFGLGLDAAGQLEDANILTSTKLTASNIRTFQSSLKIPGKSEDEIKSSLMAMMSNKTQPASGASVPTGSEDDEDQFFGSYDTNEELVAAAGGGMALYGINFFPNENDVTLKPYAPVLKKPAFVEMAGASASFEASVLHSTEQSMASTFTKTTENSGISVARGSSTSWGVSASVSAGGIASAGASADSSGTSEDNSDSKSSNAFTANHKKSTRSATMVEAITCPMKSFRIPVSTMTMSEEALDSALQVDTLMKGSQFLDTFGSHVSNGRHLLGGIFFRTLTMTSETEVETSTLLAAASTKMQESRSSSTNASVSAGGGTMGVTIAASASMSNASSSGVVKFHSSAGKSEEEAHDSRAMFQTYVRSMGPNVATPELFAEALFSDTSSWTVIDRGPFEALVPITQVLENMLNTFDNASPGKAKLENAISLLTVAWQQRAAAWKPLEYDPTVPVSLRNMIGRSFASEDAHDQIRAAVVDLFEVLELAVEANTAEAAELLSDLVLTTAKEMEDMPAGQADFFGVLQSKISEVDEKVAGKFAFNESTSEYQNASRSAMKLSSSDWAGFDLLWKERLGTIALKKALDNHLQFEQATLRLGETVTAEEPLVSVNAKYRLEICGNALRVVSTENQVVVGILFEGAGNLGKRVCAHMEPNGAFILDLTMITGFDRTETQVVLWTAPNTEGNKGSYGRMQNNGKFVVFDSKGKTLFST